MILSTPSAQGPELPPLPGSSFSLTSLRPPPSHIPSHRLVHGLPKRTLLPWSQSPEHISPPLWPTSLILSDGPCFLSQSPWTPLLQCWLYRLSTFCYLATELPRVASLELDSMLWCHPSSSCICFDLDHRYLETPKQLNLTLCLLQASLRQAE